MRDLKILPGQITFSLYALAASGDRDGGDGLDAPDLFTRATSAKSHSGDAALRRRATYVTGDGGYQAAFAEVGLAANSDA